MSNVLPRAAQKKIWIFYRNRFVFVGGIAAILMALVTILALTPSFIAARASSTSVDVSGGTPFPDTEREQERADITQVRVLTNELSPILKQTNIPDVLSEVLSARPKGVTIQRIEIAEQKEGKGSQSIVLGGIAANRSYISEYKTALSGLSYFDTITVPVGALAGAEGGQFTITLVGSF